jgi:uncharacterized protein (TIGR02646 family)
MIRLASKDLPQDVMDVLRALQREVDELPTFAERTEAAKSLWKSKGDKVGIEAFERLRQALVELCVYVQVCNYCEHSEASDIEHIYPKSFFPEYTFVWNNFLLACKGCNTGFKLDKAHVLDADGEVIVLERRQEPPTKQIAIINPRIESPDAILALNMESFKFEIRRNISKADQNKGLCTLEILGLNTRTTLLQARRDTETNLFRVLDHLRRILKAPDVDTIAVITSPDEARLDFTLPLIRIKELLTERIARYVQKHPHPSVWHAIKTIQSKTNPTWMQLFADLPMALTW